MYEYFVTKIQYHSAIKGPVYYCSTKMTLKNILAEKITRPTNLHSLRKFKLPSGRLACMAQQAFMGTFMDSILIKMLR